MAAAVYARPYVNFSATERGDELGRLAYHDLLAGRNEAGLRHLRSAVALRDDDPTAWFNLGLANQRLGNFAEAAKAFGRAAELSPANGEFRGALKHAQLMMEIDRAKKETALGGPAATAQSAGKTRGNAAGPAPAATRPIDTP